MKKKEKKIKKKKDESLEQENFGVYLKLNRLETITEIDRIKSIAVDHLANNKIDDAIYNAEKVIRIAMQHNLSELIKEQEDFINSIARKIQKEYEISEIKKSTLSIHKIYNSLLNIGNIKQAHEILERFRENYKDSSFFETIPEVQELVDKDKKIWVNYQIELQNKNDK
jgi:hypothetical protein